MRRRYDNINRALVELAQPDGPADLDQVLAPLCGANSQRYQRLIERHRLALPLVDAAIVTGKALEDLGAEQLGCIAIDDRATRLRVLRARRAAADALDGLNWVVVKGEAISTAMAKPQMRTFNDLDILVHPSHMADAAAALIEAGFDELNQNWSAYLSHLVGEVPFNRHDATVDLHWQLVALARTRRAIHFDVTAMLERQISVTSNDDIIPVLSPEDQLIHTATHCALGGATRLDQLRDLAVLADARNSQPDWEVVVHRAREWGVRQLVGHALDRSTMTLGYELPKRAGALLSGSPIRVRSILDRVAGARRLPVAAARDSQLSTARALGEMTYDSMYSRLRGSGRWDFSDPSSRLYHEKTGDERENGADPGRRRYYETVRRQA